MGACGQKDLQIAVTEELNMTDNEYIRAGVDLAMQSDQDRKPYVSIAQMGSCKVCGESQDLRCGTCFDCSDKVSGKKISETTHKIWETKNPINSWFYSEQGH